MARECEKRQRLELELDLLKRQIAITRTEHEPVKEADIISLPQPEPEEEEPTGFDWRTVPNVELVRDRRHDAYLEKLRRSVEAIQEYNAGRKLAEQYAINTSILRRLAGVAPRNVGPWVKAHQEELESYAQAQGHTYRQNSGKPAARTVMKWSEAAYEEYEWL